jgi:hypothetical protein
VGGGVVAYEYDFGSTTPLRCTVTGERVGRPGRALVRLLVRNTPPTWPCGVCEEAATLVCVSCWSEGSDAFVCDAHLRRQHHCGEADAFLPVANSPRMGVCAYTGE